MIDSLAGPMLGVAGVFIILAFDELFWRLRIFEGELSRKLAHIWVGTYIAIWPFFMTMEQIVVLSVAMLAVVTISRRYQIFKSIHDVKRRTYGEFFFPISIGICALLTDSKWIFMASILHLSLADGFAALAGTYFAGKTRYKIFGGYKSWVGTGTFLLLSTYIIFVAVAGDIGEFASVDSTIVIWLPLVATVVEGVATYGADDLLVPLVVTGILEAVRPG